jgi:hypothetical protein
MGTRTALPSPPELSLSNWTWFKIDLFRKWLLAEAAEDVRYLSRMLQE